MHAQSPFKLNSSLYLSPNLELPFSCYDLLLTTYLIPRNIILIM